MSTLLSSAELSSALNFELCDSEDDEDDNMIHEQEYEGGILPMRQHAGTGGSSQLRSRPQADQIDRRNIRAAPAGQARYANNGR